MNSDPQSAAGAIPRRLFFFSGGFLRDSRLRRILTLAGHSLHLGLPGPQDGVVVWGRSPTARRGEAVAARRDLPLIRVEDAFLRSVRPGRMGDHAIGLMIDPLGVHFDAAGPSRLERLLATDPLDDSNLLTRARDGMARLMASDLSKYNLHQSDLPLPQPGYVLVVDQTQGDASIRHSGASKATFREMLVCAQEENPNARVVIKTHPETVQGLRPGHYGPADTNDRVTLCDTHVSPWQLLEGATSVYTVSSQLGFEAIVAGHRPRVFGLPFYAGWGLSLDEQACPRRRRTLTRTQLFAAAMILAPVWYDPCRDRLCRFEDSLNQLEAETRAFRQDRAGHVATGMRLWKRSRLQAVFGREKPLIFQNDPIRALRKADATGRGILVWAGRAETLHSDTPALRVEDGFLRSRGLGADLIPPLSLVADDLGIYYDPTRESRLERLILSPLPPGGAMRAENLIKTLTAQGISKYNVGTTALPDLPQGYRILVPGQVEDDASIRLGAGEICTNLALLQAVRAAHPGAVVIYKPHPDVEAGLRPGQLDAREWADVVAHRTDPSVLLGQVDEVWTMTSLLGFEALLRGKAVTCLGAPFYAGWGLTRDLGAIPERRLRKTDGSRLPRLDLIHLVHAALIDYPRYFDPVSRRPCPPEVAVARLADGQLPRPGIGNRVLAKAQGSLASRAHWWR
jgi:capsular polysaccharide export protein